VTDDWELYARNVAATLKRAGFTRVCTALPNDATQQEIDLLEKTIATAADEKPLQQLLKNHPTLLAQEHNSCCRWIKDQVKDESTAGKVTRPALSLSAPCPVLPCERPECSRRTAARPISQEKSHENCAGRPNGGRG
jgi:hypothetical protein